MKKHLFFLAAGVLALSACTSEEVVDVSTTQGKAISFRNVVNKSSRAVTGDLDNASFTNFRVYGYYLKPTTTTPIQIFNDVPVTKSGNEWTYTGGTRYWVPGCEYSFFAYTCGNDPLKTEDGVGDAVFSLFDGTSTGVSRSLIIKSFLCDRTHQHDLITAASGTIIGLETGNEAVSLPFTHALCKVKAVFTTDFPEGYEIVISNVYLSSFYNKADFNVGAATWNNHSRNEASPATLPLNIAGNTTVENAGADSQSVETADVFMIPKIYDNAVNENARMHFTITLIEKESRIQLLQRDIIGTWSPNWGKGNIYKYNINITGSSTGIEPIVFAAEQPLSGNGSSWENQTELKMQFSVDNPANQSDQPSTDEPTE